MQRVAEVVIGMAVAGVALDRHHQLCGGHARDHIAADGVGALRRAAQGVRDWLARCVEGNATGRAGVAEHAADRGRCSCAVVDEVDDAVLVGLEAAAHIAAYQIGLAGGCASAYVRNNLPTHAPATGKAVADAVLAVVFAADDKVAATAGKVVTTGQGHMVVGAVVPLRLADIGLTLEALQLLVEHDVDRAGDGVGAVGCRGAAGDNIGALNQAAGDQVEVDGAFTRDRRKTAAIDQHQVAVHAQTAQVHDLRADVEAAPAVVGGGVGGLKGRQLADSGTEVGDVESFQCFGVELCHGGRRAEAGRSDARAGHHHFGQFTVLRQGGTRHAAAGQNGQYACMN